MKHRDYTLLGATQSLCPECLRLVSAKIIERRGRIYFRKWCPAHGAREDFVCSDVSQYDQMQYSLPGKVPASFGVEPSRGCPYDCGLCSEHEQHTCVGLVEITSSCNLTCPMCYSASAPGGKHLSMSECRGAIDRLVEVEGRPEVLQLSGGEPTIHPQFAAILRYACAQPIDVVMVNTNGLRLARDEALLDQLSELRSRVEVYLQFDGFSSGSCRTLRGEDLVEAKLQAIENLGRRGVRLTLVTTLQTDVNEDQIGRIVRFGLARPWIAGVSFQPATYSGRHVLPETLERRITFPDVVRGIAEQTDGLFRREDFMPLPCAHPNCHTMTYAFRHGRSIVPLPRFIETEKHLDLLANGITFTRPKARQLIESYLGRLGCCGGECGPTDLVALQLPGQENGADAVNLSAAKGGGASVSAAAREFFAKALAETLTSSDVFRITITSFLDPYNFDLRRLMKCCIHHVLPSGHVIPFCAYNVLYRDGHVPLPTLQRMAPPLAASRASL